MMLEAAAYNGRTDLSFEIVIQDRLLDTTSLLQQGYDMKDRHRRQDIAASFMRALAEGVSMIAADTGGETVGLSGGVAYNSLIVRTIREYMELQGIRFLISDTIPRGDGGVSFGQAVYTAKGM